MGMNRLTNAMRLVCFLMVALVTTLGTAAGPVAAQGTSASGDSYISELSDLEVEVFGDFEITDTQLQSYPEGEGEFVSIESPDALLQVAFFDDTDEPESTLELFVDGLEADSDEFELIQDGADRDLVWSLSRATRGGDELVHYLSVTPDVVGNVDVMTMLVASPDSFLDTLEATQDDVTIDGDGLFPEVDIDDLAALLEGGSTPVTTDTDANADTDSDTTSDQGRGSSSTRGSADTVESEVTGLEIEVNDPWTLSDSQVFEGDAGDEEAFTITSARANGNIAFFLDADAESALESFLGGFDSSAQSRDTIDSDYRRGIAWSLDHAVLGDGTEVIVYTQVDENVDPDYLVLAAVLAMPEDFADEFVSLQESMAIDGEAVFSNVDVADLEDLIDGGSSATTTTDEDTDTETDTGTDDAKVGQTGKEDPRENARLPGHDTKTSGGNQTETGQGGQDTGDVDLSDVGLVSANEYTSPQFDIDVEWGDTWFIDETDPDAVTSDVDGAMDSLMLTWSGDDFALLFIDIATADGLVPADFVEYWTSDDYMAENADPDAEILLDRSRDTNGAVFTRDYLSDGGEVLIVKEAVLLEDGEYLAIVTLIATPDMFGDIYADGESDVEIGGGPALDTFSTRQIERAIDQ